MSLMLSYITNTFVLATVKNSESQQFRSREKKEIKRERVIENVKRQNVPEKNVKQKKTSDDETKKPRAPQYSSAYSYEKTHEYVSTKKLTSSVEFNQLRSDARKTQMNHIISTR